MMRALVLLLLALLPFPASATPLPIRMVVVTAFEIGADTGDVAGEFQPWASEIPTSLPFPAGDRPLRYDPARALLVVSTGMGTSHAAAAIMALGTDPRFDLTKSYWLVAAIAGIDVHAGSIGSAAWIGEVVDSDFGFEIDPREAPKGWAVGKLAWWTPTPYAEQVPQDRSDTLFPLNHALRDWAFTLTRGIALADTPALQAARAPYREPAARMPPAVLKGSEISGQSFWVGALLAAHARRWVDYWTGGKGRLVMSGMEDSGVARSLAMLGRMGRADPARLMILRTASDFTEPPPGVTAAEAVESFQAHIPALAESVEAAHRVARPVVDEITRHWPSYADRIPGTP